jgi:hypothetical protein
MGHQDYVKLEAKKDNTDWLPKMHEEIINENDVDNLHVERNKVNYY